MIKPEARKQEVEICYSWALKGGGTRSESPGSCTRLGKSGSGQDCNSPGTLFFSLRTNSGTSDIQKCESLLLDCGIRLWWSAAAILRTI